MMLAAAAAEGSSQLAEENSPPAEDLVMDGAPDPLSIGDIWCPALDGVTFLDEAYDVHAATRGTQTPSRL